MKHLAIHTNNWRRESLATAEYCFNVISSGVQGKPAQRNSGQLLYND
ncbi:hypothetical protein UFOVP449_200 [uncultured Caudovirales phage]|uniref:Uncharacterized protein n=1 Tax=uncultured Caudovirales phage TaxID=2100421 RepID=A0A6J5M8X8_9CAUD|nr:hypothetical protein UFOVP449_200 [uncultured Caudovirales phage]